MTWYYGKCKTDPTQYGFYLNASDCNESVEVTDERYAELMAGCDCHTTIGPDENGNPILVACSLPEYDCECRQVRAVVVSTSEPTSSDGFDGDMWAVYE